jgi:DNA topoisomerase I
MSNAVASSTNAPATRVPGLRYVNDAEPGITRRRAGKGFAYTGPDGKRIRDRAEIDRIRALAIPPAWTDVWICTSANGHILATGRDAKGRKQYRYHPRWRSVRDEAKFDRTIAFGEALPGLRRRVRKDMMRSGLPKEKVLATIVSLLDCCFARVGNEEYAKTNGSFGLTTLRDRHARFTGAVLRLRFRGKAGKEHEVEVEDPRIVHVVRKCQAIPGQELFQYLGEDGSRSAIGSSDVNDYLREVTGEDFTAKDFRTWAGTVACARELVGAEPGSTQTARNKTVLAAVDVVACELGNTRTVCRASYIHPDVIDGYLDGSLHTAWARRTPTGASSSRGLRSEERFALGFLKARARAAKRRSRAA